MKEVTKHTALIPIFLTLPSPQRLKTVKGDMCWKREGPWKEVSAKGDLPTGVSVNYLLVKAT